jgi:hypothetical protein
MLKITIYLFLLLTHAPAVHAIFSIEHTKQMSTETERLLGVYNSIDYQLYNPEFWSLSRKYPMSPLFIKIFERLNRAHIQKINSGQNKKIIGQVQKNLKNFFYPRKSFFGLFIKKLKNVLHRNKELGAEKTLEEKPALSKKQLGAEKTLAEKPALSKKELGAEKTLEEKPALSKKQLGAEKTLGKEDRNPKAQTIPAEKEHEDQETFLDQMRALLTKHWGSLRVEIMTEKWSCDEEIKPETARKIFNLLDEHSNEDLFKFDMETGQDYVVTSGTHLDFFSQIDKEWYLKFAREKYAVNQLKNKKINVEKLHLNTHLDSISRILHHISDTGLDVALIKKELLDVKSHPKQYNNIMGLVCMEKNTLSNSFDEIKFEGILKDSVNPGGATPTAAPTGGKLLPPPPAQVPLTSVDENLVWNQEACMKSIKLIESEIEQAPVGTVNLLKDEKRKSPSGRISIPKYSYSKIRLSSALIKKHAEYSKIDEWFQSVGLKIKQNITLKEIVKLYTNSIKKAFFELTDTEHSERTVGSFALFTGVSKNKFLLESFPLSHPETISQILEQSFKKSLKSEDQNNVTVSMDKVKQLIKDEGVLSDKKFFDYIVRYASNQNLEKDLYLYKPAIQKMLKNGKMANNFTSASKENVKKALDQLILKGPQKAFKKESKSSGNIVEEKTLGTQNPTYYMIAKLLGDDKNESPINILLKKSLDVSIQKEKKGVNRLDSDEMIKLSKFNKDLFNQGQFQDTAYSKTYLKKVDNLSSEETGLEKPWAQFMLSNDHFILSVYFQSQLKDYIQELTQGRYHISPFTNSFDEIKFEGILKDSVNPGGATPTAAPTGGKLLPPPPISSVGGTLTPTPPAQVPLTSVDENPVWNKEACMKSIKLIESEIEKAPVGTVNLLKDEKRKSPSGRISIPKYSYLKIRLRSELIKKHAQYSKIKSALQAHLLKDEKRKSPSGGISIPKYSYSKIRLRSELIKKHAEYSKIDECGELNSEVQRL